MSDKPHVSGEPSRERRCFSAEHVRRMFLQGLMARKSDERVARRREVESGVNDVLLEIAGETTPPKLRKLAEDLEMRLARGASPKLNGASDQAVQREALLKG